MSEAWTIDLLADGPRQPALDFLQSLKANRAAEYKKIAARLDFAAKNGPPRNIQQFRVIKGVSGQLAEFKAGDVRIMCFFDGPQRIVLTHGFIKKRDKTEPEEIQRAVQMRDAYLMEKASRQSDE